MSAHTYHSLNNCQFWNERICNDQNFVRFFCCCWNSKWCLASSQSCYFFSLHFCWFTGEKRRTDNLKLIGKNDYFVKKMNLKNEKRRRETIRYFLTARSKKKRNCSSLFLSRRQNNVTLFKISLTEQKHALIKKGKKQSQSTTHSETNSYWLCFSFFKNYFLSLIDSFISFCYCCRAFFKIKKRRKFVILLNNSTTNFTVVHPRWRVTFERVRKFRHLQHDCLQPAKSKWKNKIQILNSN